MKIKKQKGSFLLELMIGLVVATATTVTALTIYIHFENQKRITVTTNELHTNVSIGAVSLQKYFGLAGYSFNNEELLKCNKLELYNSEPEFRNLDLFKIDIKPLKILKQTDYIDNEITPDENSSIVSFSSSSSESANVETFLIEDAFYGLPHHRLNKRYGFNLGDYFITVQKNSDYCALSQVTGLPESEESINLVLDDEANFVNSTTGNKDYGIYNIPTNPGVRKTMLSGSKVINIGKSPTFYTFYLKNNQLRLKDHLPDLNKFNWELYPDRVIVDNIVGFKAVALLDSDGTPNTIDNRLETLSENEDIKKTKAIKFLLVGKSSVPFLKEKDSAGNCTATVNNIVKWSEGEFDLSKIKGLDKDWKCYRYRINESTVVLKNFNFIN